MSTSNIYTQLLATVIEAVNALVNSGVLQTGLPVDRITVEPPRDPSHGDISTNAAMVLAKPAQKNPREIATHIAKKLELHPDIVSVDVAGPGFINLRLAPEFWLAQVLVITEEGVGYGNSSIGEGQLVNVEYVSANPTGPMHVGHTRGAVVGDALALLLQKAGYSVTKEYYINDAGSQVDVLARSAYLRYREALGDDIGAIPEGLYPGDYLVPVGEALVQHHGREFMDAPEEVWLPVIRKFAVEAMLSLIRTDLEALGVQHDLFRSEQDIRDSGMIEKALALLEQKGLIYVGVLEPPKGMKSEDWESRPQTLFKSTEYGDDVDRAIKKSDGSWTYFAPDIAYHWDKFKRGHTSLINVWGADHGGYIKRMDAAVKAITEDKADLDVKLCQMVNLTEDGQPVKMSKRAGTFVTLREVVDAVGKDVVRFIMLTRKNDAMLDFDLQKVTEQSKDNPVFYVQYAHARAKSVIRLAAREHNILLQDALKQLDASLILPLSAPAEMEIIRLLATWPRIVEAAAISHEPHRVAFYLQEVAAAFHSLWNKGNDEVDLRFIVPDNPDLTIARLILVNAVATVIASGLVVMGVEPMEEMR